MASPSSRGRKRRPGKPKGFALNIVSLIDIFTVLVFFLLLSYTELELLPESKDVRLPESVAQTKARETVVVMVSRDQILVQNKPVASVEEVLASKEPTIAGLRDALEREPVPATPELAEGEEAPPLELTIMGDREIPYRLLRKVLATCADTQYGKLSLAVLQKAGAPAQPLAGQAS